MVILIFDAAEQPHLEGLDPKYALAITSVLSPDKDFTITGKHVNDEIYWERVCREVWLHLHSSIR